MGKRCYRELISLRMAGVTDGFSGAISVVTYCTVLHTDSPKREISLHQASWILHDSMAIGYGTVHRCILRSLPLDDLVFLFFFFPFVPVDRV